MQRTRINFPVAQMVKNLPAVQRTLVQFLDWEDPLKKEMAIHSNIRAWKIPLTEESVRLQAMWPKESGTTKQLTLLLKK